MVLTKMLIVRHETKLNKLLNDYNITITRNLNICTEQTVCLTLVESNTLRQGLLTKISIYMEKHVYIEGKQLKLVSHICNYLL